MSSCTISKGIPNDRDVFTGVKTKIADPENKKVSYFDMKLNNALPNVTKDGIFNIRVGIYNAIGAPGKNVFKKWVREKFGERPILYKDQFARNSEAKISYFLNGKGYFNHTVQCDSSLNNREVTLTCDIELGPRYTIDSLIFPVDSTYSALKLDAKTQRAILKEGIFYDRERLEYERLRLAQLAGEIGFAKFNASNIYFNVDTTSSTKGTKIYLNVTQPSDSTFHKQYMLDSVFIYPNHSLNSSQDLLLNKVRMDNGFVVYESEHFIDHSLFDKLITQKKGELYNRTEEKKTINRLLDLGLFRFINIDKTLVEGDGRNGKIIESIYLTPEKLQTINGEFEINNRSGNFLGTGVTLRYIHRNLFKGGERLDASISGQAETQIGTANWINTADAKLNVRLEVPGLVTPFINIRESSQFIPRTIFDLETEFQRRIQYYTLESVVLRYGYQWKTNERLRHEFYPVVLNQLGVSNKTEEFENLLIEDPRLQQSFNNILIAGLQYNGVYSDQRGELDRSYNFLRLDVESGGNVLDLIIRAKNEENQEEVFGLPYAQFIRTTLDYRRYFPLNNSSTVATRILLGGGFAYRNSQELPYIKQYVIGGSNSVRAFGLRQIGPGAFFNNSNTVNPQFIDQTGDVKIEINAEVRFPIFSVLKGAFFLDAGNVWLLNGGPDYSKFKLGRSLEQLAIGTGVGVRLDFDFFVLRFDFATPLRGPTENKDFTWYFNDGYPDRNVDKVTFNLGIGYPF